MRVLLVAVLVGASLLTVAATEAEKVEEVEEEVKEEVKVVMDMGREEEGDVPIVMTSVGKVSGIREKTTEGKTFFSYYGIPYAKPPVGDLRFKVSQAGVC